MTKSRKKAEHPKDTPPEPRGAINSTSPLVFISHDTRDADLAEAFGNLLTDASGGVLQSFRSSDRKGTSGIEFGAEWYSAIMSKLSDATDVVALLTPHSLERPWILYEAGVAKGKLDTTVLGLAISIPLEKTNNGPFAQFQNCADDEDSLTKLVLQLIRRNPQASPREEAVRRQVQAFKLTIEAVAEKRAKTPHAAPKMDENAVAKMFEEVKILVRDLPDRVSTATRELSSEKRKHRRLHPMMLEELMDTSLHRERGRQSVVGLLILFSLFRETQPWLYELGMKLYSAIMAGDMELASHIRKDITIGVDFIRHSSLGREMIRSSEDEEVLFMTRHFSDMIGELTKRWKTKGSVNEAKDPS